METKNWDLVKDRLLPEPILDRFFFLCSSGPEGTQSIRNQRAVTIEGEK